MTGRRSPPDRTVDRLLDALADERRRRVLALLADRTPPLDVRAIAGEMAASARAEEARASIEALAVELHHLHLPKLADAGLLDYDEERRVVEEDRGRERVESALELVGEFSFDR